MSRVIASRIARLEAKRRANEPPMREIGVFAGKPIWKTEERNGVMHFVPIMSDEEYVIFARDQQKRLTEQCAAYDAMLNEGMVEDDKATTPAHTGFKDQLAPGASPLKFRYYTDASGQEWQVSLEDGQTWRV
ncbi:hypothetical protein MASR1M32_16390 [Rhodobacter sp.]